MIYVLSDIHGNLAAWNDIKAKLSLTDSDQLYILGDVIDRGAYGMEILLEVMSRPNTHMLLGNHEYMMMNALGLLPSENTETYNTKLWYQNGGMVTHNAWLALTEQQRLQVNAYLLQLPLEYHLTVEGQEFLLCHAAPEELYEKYRDFVGENKMFFCVWDRDALYSEAETWEGESLIIIGHTPTQNLNDTDPMEIYRTGRVLNIDCGAAYPEYGGRLCCIRLPDLAVKYSEASSLNERS